MKNLAAHLLLLYSLCLAAQTNSIQNSPTLTEGTPSAQGMSQERLDKIDLMLSSEISKGNLPGAVALIARNGKIVFHKAYGMANTEKGEEMEKDAIFRIASQTKAITATAVMMLWEEGKFKLDDPISKYIPQFEAAQILDTFNEADSTYTTKPAENQITIRDLITHTSGIGYGMIDGDARFRKIYAKAGIIDAFTSEKIRIGENIKKLATLPLHHEPGEAWTYSEGLDVLGYFIEIVSGMPFDAFLRTRIFEPLQMNDTYFYLPKEKADRLVAVQYKDGNKWKRFETPVFDIDYPNSPGTFFSGGAGLSSTARDYANFLQMYLNGGELNGKRLLSRTTVNSILSNQIGTIWDGGKDYGLAFEIVNKKGAMAGGEGSEGTFSWGGYFNTQYFADPKENVIGIIMKQTQGPVNDDTGWKFRQMVSTTIDD
ncbi:MULTISPECIES: serine hydrolase domain-containing protein [Maribacter]|uniref:Serine hydrolase domain-containing protein n=1 Tax=Maribacter flavus TaxID=1658664 RepID=A0ABU7IDJ2_9FLAO|nr:MULTISPECIES: serine hydrolase domain-containing protein [Maribacter]MDC6403861.1 serine hydrolase [Maribacter sp. PR66]MEE1971002.1 serine hydrolase domain-containing protein [Maribacter flavus]